MNEVRHDPSACCSRLRSGKREHEPAHPWSRCALEGVISPASKPRRPAASPSPLRCRAVLADGLELQIGHRCPCAPACLGLLPRGFMPPSENQAYRSLLRSGQWKEDLSGRELRLCSVDYERSRSGRTRLRSQVPPPFPRADPMHCLQRHTRPQLDGRQPATGRSQPVSAFRMPGKLLCSNVMSSPAREKTLPV